MERVRKSGFSHIFGTKNVVKGGEGMSKKKSWKKGLSKKLVEEIQNIQPEKVEFVEVDRKYVFCEIRKDGESAIGVAICSVLDEFDSRVGRNKAAGRAVKAFKKKSSSEPIRRNWSQFSKSWTIRQLVRVLECPSVYKSFCSKVG